MKHECDICGKAFSRNYNLERHREKVHDIQENATEDEEDATDQESVEESEQESQNETEEEEGSENDVQEEEEETWERSPWEDLGDDVLLSSYQEKLDELVNVYTQEGGSKEEAYDRAESAILPHFRDAVRELYKDKIIFMREMRADPIHKKVMDTVRRLRDEEDYDYEEALDYALEKRKFLINRNISLKRPQTETSDEDEPPQKRFK